MNYNYAIRSYLVQMVTPPLVARRHLVVYTTTVKEYSTTV